MQSKADSLKPRLEAIEPLSLKDVKKRIPVSRYEFELWLQFWDWTYHQLARGEFPQLFIDNIPENKRGGYSSDELLVDFWLGCICADPVLWCMSFLREPDDRQHKDPYNFFDYQMESTRFPGDKLHKDGAEVGKTREIVATSLWPAFTVPGGSGLIGAPLQGHVDEIINAMDNQLNWNPELGKQRWHRRIKDGWKKHPYHDWYFKNEFVIYFRPSGHDGNPYRGIHVWTYAKKDEGVKDKHVKQWSEFWRAMKPGCIAGVYSVPDGDRSCDFFRLGQGAVKTEPPKDPAALQERLLLVNFDIWRQRARGRQAINLPGIEDIYREAIVQKSDEEQKEDVGPAQSLKDVEEHILDIRFKLFHWPKTIMPEPFWSPTQRAKFRTRYKGEGSPEYKHNVLGIDGDPESSVFPWEQFKWCIKDIPEYRCMKILVDAVNNEVIIRAYRTEVGIGPDGPDPKAIEMLDTVYRKAGFFDYEIRPDGTMTESEFRKIIKSFFPSAPGLKRGGADLGYSGDPTELIVKNIIGQKDRVIARLRLEHVTYDQQCQALDALDDVFGPKESMSWGTDFGNAGSAVAHDLQGLPQYQHKDYIDRLKGFMFESKTSDVNKQGEEIKDGKSGEPKKVTLKELATDLMVKDMQIMASEYPGDPDFAFYFPNHTVRNGQTHRLYKDVDDHLIDAIRTEQLAGVLGFEQEDEFASGSRMR
jgi:hypothetical protein